MHTKFWLVIKDDTRKTFEVCGKEGNTNYFTNQVHGMQRAGMNVSCTTPPVTNHAASKTAIKVLGYTSEAGLEERLINEYAAITRKGFEDLDDIED